MKSRLSYKVLVDDLRERIARGEWPADELLPSYRTLAEQYRCSINTVKKARTALEADGLVSTAHKKGTVVKGSADKLTGTLVAVCIPFIVHHLWSSALEGI